MSTSFPEARSCESIPSETTDVPGVERFNRSLDRTLTEIRSGRRLEAIVSSVESFLNGQVARLETAIAECNRSVENDKIVQRIMADFEIEKQSWEADRQSEILRLSAAGKELIKGWEQLELEREQLANQLNQDSRS